MVTALLRRIALPQIHQIPWLGIKSRVHGETERGSADRNIRLIECFFGFNLLHRFLMSDTILISCWAEHLIKTRAESCCVKCGRVRRCNRERDDIGQRNCCAHFVMPLFIQRKTDFWTLCALVMSPSAAKWLPLQCTQSALQEIKFSYLVLQQ